MKKHHLHIQLCTTLQEKEAAKDFRQKHFFDERSFQDPYRWTFDHPDHSHFLLYRDEEIVGYIHIQHWPDHRAAIRIIVIDQKIRSLGLGKHLLASCEQTLKKQGVKVLHTESTPSAHLFYKKLGYIEMPFNDPEGLPTDPRDIAMGKNL